ncbi:hypothetical protein F511_43956 [Dorcoceras hygrometricum]|uniref:Uncharacterized protein n=1 Tax=Dorcoceras hygrometricum TaxID=472368 RepID=A0A2Z7BDN5_9LAMI|nr:hypothetical protein F511_43956 [Dorcoceras hygrometricum]
MGIVRIMLFSDSQLVVQQSRGNFDVMNEKMVKYAKALTKMTEDFLSSSSSRYLVVKMRRQICLCGWLTLLPQTQVKKHSGNIWSPKLPGLSNLS